MTQPQLARRMATMKASEIRELLKLTERPEVISFSGGLPAPEVFPVEAMASCAAAVLAENGPRALQYSTTEGCPELRQAIARRMSASLETEIDPQHVLITCGSQQGLDLTGKLLIDEGDTVLCESPTYIGALQALNAFQPRYVEVATDDDGMLPDDLQRLLAREQRVKLIYVVPNFQNPSGRTWSRSRRQALLALAASSGVPVIEDDPYGELRYEGDHQPSLRSLDVTGTVVYLGTFSKILCPGLRIGWLVAPPALHDKYVLAKQGTDLHTSTFSQMQIATYLERNDIDASLARVRTLYRHRRNLMVRSLERELPSGARFTRPQGGLFLWVELPAQINARELLRRCLDHDVSFVPGGSFFPNGGHENTMRLNFSNMSEDRIEEGVARIGRVLRGMLNDTGAHAPARELVASAS